MTAARRFLVCIHDATPAYDRETRIMIDGLAPLLGRRFAFAVVPDWHGEWPLTAHREYCTLVRESAGELLLHGCFHRRGRGWGPTAVFAGNCDEMNGLTPEATRQTLRDAQRVFADAFGEPARGFVAPAWQRGHVRVMNADAAGLEHVLGFFTLDSRAGRRVPLATWSWDCGRWSWLGHVGHGIGRALASSDQRLPVLAIHPRDLQRGFWPAILTLVRQFLDRGYQPWTPSALLEASGA